MENTRLNLGCGRNIKKGWINLDRSDLPGVDVVHDIENIPLPFGNETFDTILCEDILEHVEVVPVMRELHRILKNGGELLIRVPHFTSRRAHIDPTHKRAFSIKTFTYFTCDIPAIRDHYFDFSFKTITHSHIFFEKGNLVYNHLVEKIVNSSRMLKETAFEATFLSRLFPASHIEVRIVK